ncbi:MAG: sn-glycerol-3-phosphate ABC transporter ATP-binding protein UgpC [Alphaproteobacteria bacterium]|nr:sn-glycerol-3-phosphate ABC transporter ATP-binding protein UgpC [Alphaproteobacteria bacterium]
MAHVKLTSVRKSFGSVEIIMGVDIEIDSGEFVVFVGPSGCGKSTLLRMIAGLEDITSGTIEIGGRVVNDLPPKDRSIAMVFQSYAIFPHMSVRENVGFGLTIKGVDKAEKEKKVLEAARILQMENLLDRRPSQLSGGQRQRVAIGRAIVRDPSVFLFDEPLSNLDAALRLDMRMEIGKLHQSLGASMIYVTHDQIEAMTLADRIVVLKDGQVMQTGTPMELFHNPDNLFVAGFIGAPRMNFFEVDAAPVGNGAYRIGAPDVAETVVTAKKPLPEGERAILGIRPQHLSLIDDAGAASADQGVLTGKVALVERLGTETIVNLSLPSGAVLIAALDGDNPVAMGSAVTLAYARTDAHLFAKE